MRITQWGEYGIHCAAFIAQKQREGLTAVPANDIAAAQNIALDYTQQILQRLRKANIVKSVRGPQGGYQLARDAKDISLQDLLIAAEGDTFEVICETKPLSNERCAAGAHCNLRPLWFALKDHVNTFLTKYNLQQIVDDTLGLPDIQSGVVQIGGDGNNSLANKGI
jgi:Rrf2 family protein